MVKIEEFLKSFSFDKTEPIVVAVSGGPDSMALLSLLENYFQKIICAHVNHNTGRIGQDEEEQFVKAYCEKKNHIFESMKIETYGNSNFHDQAHKIRYCFFESILEKYHASYLFTAHHGDDLMETMLFRMIRGATMKSLSGFSKVSKQKNYYIVRPLLQFTKQQLLEYNHQNHIPYRMDPSNDKDIYTRNRIRKHLLPFLKEENQNVHLKFLKLSEMLQETDFYIQKQVEKEVTGRFSNNALSIQKWECLDKMIQKRILQDILARLYQENQDRLEDCHVEQILNLIHTSKSGSKIDLPGSYYVQKEYQCILFLRKEKEEGYEYLLEKDMVLPNGHSIEFVEKEETDSNFVCRLKKEDIVFPLIVRTRKEQDRIFVKGLNNSKKVKEIFINEKVPVHLRQNYPIVTDKTGKIIWIPGLKKSQFDKTKEEKYDIILRYY